LTEEFRLEDLIDRVLLVETLNSTLIHFLLSSQVEGSIDPDRVDSLTQGLLRTRRWIEETTSTKGIPQSTSNILGLIVKRMAQLESLLPKLSQKAKDMEIGREAQEILTILEGGGKVTRKPAAQIASAEGEQEGVVSIVPPEPETPPEPYKKVEVEDDEWGMIGQTNRMINQYSKRCHTLLPTFWFEVLKEIHRYRSDSPHMSDAIEIPGQILVRIVKGLLTEAPGARLLQDLSKHRPPEKYLDPGEMERVERAVAKYFAGLEGILKGEEPNPEDKISDAQTAFDGFGWGGPELEKRLIKRINQRCQEAIQSAEQVTDAPRKVIFAETAKMLCKLQHAILAEPRLREILAQMKP
jgi:hypothetical protein